MLFYADTTFTVHVVYILRERERDLALNFSAPTLMAPSKWIPVRAIPSSLFSKLGHPIPLPSESYEPLVKSVLQHRLVHSIFLQSTILTWAAMTLSGIWQRYPTSITFDHIYKSSFNFVTILASLLVWVFAALPVIVLRRKLLTPIRDPATSPANLLSSSLPKPTVRRAFLVYTASALVLLIVHILLSYVVESTDPKLRLFVKSRKHPYYLNGRLIFIIISQFVTAIVYGIRNVLLDRFAFRWRIAAQNNVTSPKVTISDVFRSFMVSSILSLLVLPLTATIFTVSWFFLPVLHKIPFVSLLLTPFTAHFLRASLSIFLPLRHFDLLQRALHLGFVSMFVWDIVDTLFDNNVAKRISVANSTPNPNQTLISGISSQDLTLRYFAYRDLCTIAEDISPTAVAQRTALFADQKYTPTLWSHLIQESLSLLGQHYQLLLRRGNPEPIPPSPPVPIPIPAANSGSVPVNPIPTLQKSTFRAVSSANASASNSTPSRAVSASVDAIELPEIFRSETHVEIMPKQEWEVRKGTVKVDVVSAKKKFQSVRKLCNKCLPLAMNHYFRRWEAWWKEDRLSKNVEKSLPLKELDVVVIEVISRLICASLHEDQYGVVQRDIPRTLELLLSFLSAIEEYYGQVRSLYVPPPSSDEEREGNGNGASEAAVDGKLALKGWEERMRLQYEVEQSMKVLGIMIDVLKEAVVRIVRTFGYSLKVFKLPPRTEQKLQLFLDYC